MRITSIEEELIAEIRFLNAGRGPGNFYTDTLPIHRGYVDALPDETSAIVVTADLQGRETFASAAGQPPRLLGEVLPALLRDEVLPTLDVPSGKTGVFLAGDFYTVPTLDKRGGSGDVTSVWSAFSAEFDWVVGVAGNHDLFGAAATAPVVSPPVHFLDDDVVSIGGRSIAGLSGIPGNPRRPWRRPEVDYIDRLSLLLLDSPDVVLLHDGPDVPESGFRGSSSIRQALHMAAPTLVVRGHSHWGRPFATLEGGTQVLNVDARVVILTGE